MNVSLTPSLEEFVRASAASGDYNNASEVVREALRMLKKTEEERAAKISALRKAIAEGDRAIATGDYIDLNSDADLDAVFADQ